jgi:hypothetical protein
MLLTTPQSSTNKKARQICLSIQFVFVPLNSQVASLQCNGEGSLIGTLVLELVKFQASEVFGSRYEIWSSVS